MSKHTNKVHGKLNVIIVAVILIIGVLGYLLVQSDSIEFNPEDLSGSGMMSIKGAQKAQKYDNKSDVVVSLDGEEAQQLINSQAFQKVINDPDFAKLASSPDFGKLMASPDFGKLMASPDFGKLLHHLISVS